MEDIQKIKEKYEEYIFDNLDKEKFNKIINFLIKEKCDYIKEFFCNYLDLFNIEYEEFVKKYNKLNKKYNGSFLEKASEDMNLLEEFYSI